MVLVAIGGALVGAVFGLRFKVLVLIPAIRQQKIRWHSDLRNEANSSLTLRPHRPGLGKPQMVGVRRASPAHQTHGTLTSPESDENNHRS